jgi:hypothetical protein
VCKRRTVGGAAEGWSRDPNPGLAAAPDHAWCGKAGVGIKGGRTNSSLSLSLALLCVTRTHTQTGEKVCEVLARSVVLQAASYSIVRSKAYRGRNIAHIKATQSVVSQVSPTTGSALQLKPTAQFFPDRIMAFLDRSPFLASYNNSTNFLHIIRPHPRGRFHRQSQKQLARCLQAPHPSAEVCVCLDMVT